MALKVALDRVVPLTQARARLSELVEQTSDDQFWILTHHGRPRVALVDVKYLDRLIQGVWFNDLLSRSQAGFDEYLRKRGLDPATLTDGEVEKILQG
jgi:prevent-host-death family protein